MTHGSALPTPHPPPPPPRQVPLFPHAQMLYLWVIYDPQDPSQCFLWNRG